MRPQRLRVGRLPPSHRPHQRSWNSSHCERAGLRPCLPLQPPCPHGCAPGPAPGQRQPRPLGPHPLCRPRRRPAQRSAHPLGSPRGLLHWQVPTARQIQLPRGLQAQRNSGSPGGPPGPQLQGDAMVRARWHHSPPMPLAPPLSPRLYGPGPRHGGHANGLRRQRHHHLLRAALAPSPPHESHAARALWPARSATASGCAACRRSCLAPADAPALWPRLRNT